MKGKTMISDNEYSILLNKYNLLVSEIQVLKKQIRDKEGEWAKRDGEHKVVDKECRDFCSSILAKDKSEMMDEGHYSWSSVTTIDMIKKARRSLEKYNADRTELMNQLMEEIERRSEENDSLKMQNSMLLTGGEGRYNSPEELENEIKKQTAIKKAEANGISPNKQVFIKEDDEDVDDSEIETLKKAIRESTFTSTGTGVYHKPAPKKVGEIKKEKSERADIAVVDLRKTTHKWKDVHWTILRIIGEGASRYDDIKTKVFSEIVDVNESALRMAIQDLSQLAITKVSCSTPLLRKFVVYRLSENGKLLYMSEFHKKPNKSEAEQILAEHGSLNHGYCIVQLANEMKKHPDKYEDVCAFNRSRNTISIPGIANKYIPDISYKYILDNNRYKSYIEYETGQCNYADLAIKLEKMLYITREIMIIVESNGVLEKYISSVNRYIKDRHSNPVALKGKKIKICSVMWFVEKVLEGEEWACVYDFNKGVEPKVNLPKLITRETVMQTPQT